VDNPGRVGWLETEVDGREKALRIEKAHQPLKEKTEEKRFLRKGGEQG